MRLSIFIFFLCSFELVCQTSSKSGFWPADIDVLSEYYLAVIDSSFIKRNHIAEIKVTETLKESDRIIFSEPVLIDKYSKDGKRTHVELNSWFEHGGAVRSTDFYSDSTIALTIEYSKQENQEEQSSTTIFKTFKINDTLSRTKRYKIRNDSLVLVGQFATPISRKKPAKTVAAQGEEEPVPPLPGTGTIRINSNRSCIPVEQLPRDPAAQEETDSLGRVVKIKKARTIVENGAYVKKPSSVIIIRYHKATKLPDLVEEYHADINWYSGANSKVPVDTGIYVSGLSYQLTASAFESGIPTRIIISTGMNGSTKRIFRAEVIRNKQP